MIIGNLDTQVLDVREGRDPAAAEEDVRESREYAAMIFPPDFSSKVLSAVSAGGTGAAFTLYLDQTNVNVATSITQTVNRALVETMDEVGRTPPVSVEVVSAFGKTLKFIDFFVPGIMAFAVYMITTLLTLVSFVGERTGGTLSRMLATSLTERDIVLGYATTFSIIGIFQALLLLVIGILVFKITVLGNVLLAFLVVALLAVVSQALGILLSSTARREAQAIQILPFVILPAFLLAGIFWPVEAIPSWLRPLCYIVPPFYTVDASRKVMLKGYGIGQIWPDIVILLGMAAVFLFLAILSLKTRKD
jgi:ABC-2 type transport system permease protein